MSRHFGKYHESDAVWKHNPKDPANSFINQVTRRNREIAEGTPLVIKVSPRGNPALPWPLQQSSRFDSTATSAE